jgi:tripartite-type tricarboxylate transporter receptor subunit TctC
MRKLTNVIAIASCGLITAPVPCAAVDNVAYPIKPVRLLVGFAPGGGSDTLGRMVGQKLSENLGQSIVIDNRPGANGVIAMELTARAPADGYTLMIASGSSVVSATLVTKVPFDINKAFAPVSLLAMQPYVLLVPQSLPVNSVKELVAHAKSKPAALNYGSSGHGSSAHLGMELFKQMAGVDMVHIAYKGIGPAIVDLMSGRVQLLFASAVSAGNAVKTGKVKALAVTSARRAKSLPDLPTIAESGVSNFDLSGWYGVVAPAGAPQAVIAKLNREISRVLNLPDIQTRLSNDGSEASPSTPAQLRQIIQAEIQRWQKLMQQTNLGL